MTKKKRKTKPAAGMKIESVDITTLVEDPANVRRHSERNIEVIKGSLARFGLQKPIVVDRKGIVRAGNGTLVAARALGWKKIDVTRTKLVDGEATAYSIADNRSGDPAVGSEWDSDALASALTDLKDGGADLDELGFDDKDLDEILGTPEIVEDEVPDVPEEAITKPGDLWLLGEHRVLCGDCTRDGDVRRAVDECPARLLVTDPPYGLGDKWNGLQALRGNAPVVNDDRADWRRWLADALGVWLSAALATDVAGYIWFSWSSNPRDLVESFGLRVHATIVWVKEHFNVGRADYRTQHEACLYFSRGRRQWYGGSNEPDVWDARRVEQVREHPTQKPVSLISRCIRNSSKRNGVIFDPFLGSGTTLIAAEQLGRKCYSLESEPGYVDVCVKRWENLTGKKAERQPAEVA